MLVTQDGNTQVYEIICQIVTLALKVRLIAKNKFKKKQKNNVFQLEIKKTKTNEDELSNNQVQKYLVK